MEYKSKDHDSYDKVLGRISHVSFGMGGYQDVGFGLSLTFECKGFECGTFISGGWAYGCIDPDKYSKWTEADRTKAMAEMCKTICEILRAARVDDVSKLVGKPIEVATGGWNDLKSWRILEEVL